VNFRLGGRGFQLPIKQKKKGKWRGPTGGVNKPAVLFWERKKKKAGPQEQSEIPGKENTDLLKGEKKKKSSFSAGKRSKGKGNRTLVLQFFLHIGKENGGGKKGAGRFLERNLTEAVFPGKKVSLLNSRKGGGEENQKKEKETPYGSKKKGKQEILETLKRREKV